MNLSSLLLWYARNGLLRPLRRSAYRKFCRRNRGQSFIAELASGQRMRTIIGDSVDDQIYALGEYEPQVSALVRHLAGHCETFVDVGCNIGYFSCLVACANPEARIIAIDPNPRMIERTRENLALNGDGDALLVNVGIGARNREMTLHVPRDRHSLSSLAYRPDRGIKGGVNTLQVEVRRLFDAVSAGRATKALLKVDAEGFEHEVFSGITPAESEALDYVVFEHSGRNLARAGVGLKEVFGIPWFSAYTAYLFDDAGALIPLDTGRLDGDSCENVVLVRNGLTDVLGEFMISGG